MILGQVAQESHNGKQILVVFLSAKNRVFVGGGGDGFLFLFFVLCHFVFVTEVKSEI